MTKESEERDNVVEGYSRENGVMEGEGSGEEIGGDKDVGETQGDLGGGGGSGGG